MSVSKVNCPYCGSPHVTSTAPDQYRCKNCSTLFNFVRPDVQRHDVVSHNCPQCGKAVEPGAGIRCMKCGKYDLCQDCVSLLNPDGYVCKSCLKANGQDCSICGKFAYITCKSCVDRMAKGDKPRDELVSKTCSNCYDTFFTDYLRLKDASGGMPPKWGKVSFHCPRCGQVCRDCVMEKKQVFGGNIYACKNCGSQVKLREETM